MRTAGASELGYANTALITALFDVLVEKKVLTGDDLQTIVDVALRSLETTYYIGSVTAASTFIKEAIGAHISKHVGT